VAAHEGRDEHLVVGAEARQFGQEGDEAVEHPLDQHPLGRGVNKCGEGA